jgi:hypothetical protein
LWDPERVKKIERCEGMAREIARNSGTGREGGTEK